ncbi:MAG: imidazole glycerol phosphate synthase subunit HisH [Candidatus Methanomethylicaceae archaeon]|nr:imidazole glycerol phosphate synthase subunit HisH [Candidatus Verstraetearchaeota archaeon]
MMRVVILDLGLGNLLSIKRGLERAGGEVVLASSDAEVSDAEALVIPGVGAFRDGIRALKGFGTAVEEIKSGKKPMLGVCLGMQLLFERSYEGGEYEGLGLIRGEVVRLPNSVKVPHMGWNEIVVMKNSPLLKDLNSKAYFYFVHSYYCRTDEDVVLATTDYGVEIPAIVEKKNLVGTQFHPEKSGKNGLLFLKDFLGWCRR